MGGASPFHPQAYYVLPVPGLIMADDLSEEEKAQRAKEFRTKLNRRRPTRKRYSFSSPFLQSQRAGGSLEQSSLEASGLHSPNSSLGDAVPLVNIGGEAIYREISEKQSLSKWRNAVEEMIPQPIRKALCPPTTREEWKRFLFVHLPVVHWLWLYRPKQLIGDVVSGITIGVTHIPQGESHTERLAESSNLVASVFDRLQCAKTEGESLRSRHMQ